MYFRNFTDVYHAASVGGVDVLDRLSFDRRDSARVPFFDSPGAGEHRRRGASGGETPFTLLCNDSFDSGEGNVWPGNVDRRRLLRSD